MRDNKNPLEAANLLIIEGQFEDAEKFILWILKDPQAPEALRENLYYFLGLSLSGQKKYKQAIEVFRSILDQHPQATKVRLILGRLLFLEGNDDAAKRHLDLVLADQKVPAQLHNTALEHLAAIEKRNGWNFSGYFNLKRDSNSTKAPSGSNRVVYLVGLPFTDRREKRDSIGGDINVSAVHQRQISTDRQWSNNFSLSQSVLPGALDAATSFYYSSGIRQFYENNSIGLTGLTSHHWSNGHLSSNTYGVQLDGQYIINRRLRTSAVIQHTKNNSVANDGQDANGYYAEGRVDLGITPVMNGNFKFYGQRNVAEDSGNNYNSTGWELGLRRDLPWGITSGMALSRSRILYQEDHSFIGEPLEYTDQSLKFTLLKRDWRFWGITPELALTLFKRRSNYSHFSYENNSYNLNLTKNF